MTRRSPLRILTNTAIAGFTAATLGACSSVAGPESSGLSLSSDPLLGKFVWYDLITDDVNRAQAFYGSLLGWSFEAATRPDDGGPYTLVKSGDRYLGGMVQLEDGADGTEYSRWLSYMSVENVDSAAALTQSAGGNVLAEPRDVGNLGRAAAVADPQGAVLGVVRSRYGDPDDDNPMAQGRVVWNELLTSDMQAAAGFYTELAGLRADSLSRRGGEYIIMHAGDIERAGIMATPAAEIPPTWLTYFAVPDPVTAAESVTALGGTVLIPPNEEFREGTLALVQDPTGAVLVLQQWPL